MLAHEVSHLQSLPQVQQYMNNPHSLSRIRCNWTAFNDKPFNKGELVSCFTSSGRQQNEWLVSFVEGPHPNDASGLCLRAIGTDQTCNYGNESFIRITGIPERLLWEGDKHQFALKLNKAINEIGSYGHRFRGLEFGKDGEATVFIGECFGGLSKKTKPYPIHIKFTKKTSIKNIASQMKAQGFGTREFEPDDGAYSGPMEGLASFKREDIVGAIAATGIELKPEFK